MLRTSQRSPAAQRQNKRVVSLADENGAVLLEFALSSLLFFTVLFGILDFGQAIWRYNMAADLAQEGARWAAVRGVSSLTPASAADVQAYVQSRSPGITVTVTTTSVDASRQCTTTSVNPSSLHPGSGMCVSVEATYTRSSALIPIPSLTLRATAQMIMAR
jgi:Flp pilus assembly protein TadG